MSDLTIENLVQNGAAANQDIDISLMKYTSRLIVQRSLARGWSIASFPSAISVLFVQIPGHKSLVRIFSASPSSMSYPSSKIAKNKSLTSSLLASAGLPVIPELMVSQSKIQESKQQIQDFLKKHEKIVVKPLDASHGNGVVTGITALTKAIEAAKKAAQYSRLKKILLQRQYDGYDIRILCINHKFINSITRIPARVVGDGKSSVEELIHKENKSPLRSTNYKTKLNVIDIKKARQYMGKTIKYVPTKGETVQVVGISNIGAGGERMNIAQQIPDWLKRMAEDASKALELPVCGVDFLVKDLPQQNSTRGEINPVVLEVNECPMMTMYDDLSSPEQLAVIDNYLDYLAQ